MVLSGKFESTLKTTEKNPHMIVLSNAYPNKSMLTANRWNVIDRLGDDVTLHEFFPPHLYPDIVHIPDPFDGVGEADRFADAHGLPCYCVGCPVWGHPLFALDSCGVIHPAEIGHDGDEPLGPGPATSLFPVVLSPGTDGKRKHSDSPNATPCRRPRGVDWQNNSGARASGWTTGAAVSPPRASGSASSSSNVPAPPTPTADDPGCGGDAAFSLFFASTDVTMPDVCDFDDPDAEMCFPDDEDDDWGPTDVPILPLDGNYQCLSKGKWD